MLGTKLGVIVVLHYMLQYVVTPAVTSHSNCQWRARLWSQLLYPLNVSICYYWR